MKKLKVLVLEDDPFIRNSIRKEFKKLEVESITIVKNLKNLKEAVKTQRFDLAYLDVYIGHEPAGLEALDICNNYYIQAYMLSSSNDESIIKRSINNKCLAYLSKTHIKENLSESLEDFIKFNSSELDARVEMTFAEEWITSDIGLKDQIKKAVTFDWKKRPLLVTGETGVGKTAIIKILHKIKHGDDKPYVEFNSGGRESDSTLTDAELFGYKKGAFTGANENQKGKFDLAQDGTLFFDEIGNISISTQEKMIKAIDEKKFSPVGGNKDKEINAAFVFATLKDLKSLVESGKMKHDFFARISGFNLHIKPLRERRDDIILILHALMKKEKRRFIIADEAKDLIYKYDWPYNIRELVSEFENWKVEAAANRNVLTKELLDKKIVRNISPFKQKKSKDVLTNSALNYIKKYGYQEALSKFHDELVAIIKTSPEFFDLDRESHLQVEKKIGIPRRTYKKLLEDYEDRYANV